MTPREAAERLRELAYDLERVPPQVDFGPIDVVVQRHNSDPPALAELVEWARVVGAWEIHTFGVELAALTTERGPLRADRPAGVFITVPFAPLALNPKWRGLTTCALASAIRGLIETH